MILDEETTKITSLSFSQSDLLKKEIYLFERLDMPKRANMQNVTAIVFVRNPGKILEISYYYCSAVFAAKKSLKFPPLKDRLEKISTY